MPEMIYSAEEIKAKREALGWTLDELARRAGLWDRSHAWKVEKGSGLASTLVKVSRALDEGEETS